MGPKKGAGDAEGGEDVSCDNLWKFYKKNCQAVGCDISKQIRTLYDTQWVEEGEAITKFHLWDEMGWQGVAALMEAAIQAKYKHCDSIRLWKTKCEDEGVREVVKFLNFAKSVKVLEFLDAEITPLGCEFLSQALHPTSEVPLQILKLDHNNIGSEGLMNLVQGLACNKTIQCLSMTHCGLTKDCADALFDIVIYTQSAMLELYLGGNQLEDEGVIKLMKGLMCAKSLVKVSIADNQFSDTEEVLAAIEKTWKKNEKLTKYDFRHNDITDEGVEFLIGCLKEAGHVFELGVSEWINEETMDALQKQLKENKPAKGKGKKKKK